MIQDSDIEFKVNAKPYNKLKRNRRKRFNFFWGGAASTKSWTIAQFLVLEKFQKEENIGILCVRKTRPAVKNSCWKIILHWIRILKCKVDINKTDLTITDIARNNFIQFIGCDDVEKFKSIENINYVWIEEATELRRKDFMQLNLRARAANKNTYVVKKKSGKKVRRKRINQIFISFNPVDPVANRWLEKITIEGETAKRSMLHINHDDNPFLSKEEHDEIEALIDQDPEYNKIYRLGQWATPTALIYSNWDTVDYWPEEVDSQWGLDFGFVNPAGLVEVRFNEDLKECWVKERLYQSKLTNPMLIDKLEETLENKSQLMIADSAEPKSIMEIRNSGFNIQPVKKGPDSVRFGVKSVQSVRVHIYKESTNLIDEMRTYKWRMDKDENVIEGEPVKFKDHLVDALRYIISRVKGYVKVGLVVVDTQSKAEEREQKNLNDMLNKEYTKEEIAEHKRQAEMLASEDDDGVWTGFN